MKIVQLSELKVAADTLLKEWPAEKVFVFIGEMGVGKTTFIKRICEALGSEDSVSSPTYALVNEYQGDRKIYHFDLYRLNDIEEALDIGFTEYLEEDAICLIEWPQIVLPLLDEFVEVSMELEEDGSRQIQFRKQG